MKKYDIYLIWGKDQDGNILRYYGSTADIIKRKSEHKKNYERWVKAGRPNNKKCSSVYILDNGDWKMEKIDEIDGDRWQARKLEGEYQKNNDCVNVKIECRTQKEYREDNKDKYAERNKKYYIDNKDKLLEKVKLYYADNKDKVLEYHKQYHINNKDKLAEKHKQYHINNKDKLTEKHKEWYEKNKQDILEKQKEKIICECGAESTKSHISRHRKSKKHINFISNNELNV
jgi:hypothetical protein